MAAESHTQPGFSFQAKFVHDLTAAKSPWNVGLLLQATSLANTEISVKAGRTHRGIVV